ncbi:hypothetical protein CR513_02299, partial [Mucuna pruriens]
MPPWENNFAIEDLILQFQQNLIVTIHDVQMQVRQLADTSEPGVNSRVQQLARSIPVSFPNRTVSTKRSDIDEDLLKLFSKAEINIPLLDAIKQIPKYAKFLKELCVHKRKKVKGVIEIGGVVSTLANHRDTSVQQVLPKKCQDPGIFAVPCTIGGCTFTNSMLDLGALIIVMLASIYRSLNLGDLEPTRMVVQLSNKSVVQPLGVLEDVLVQVNKLIFPVDFYVLDMEDVPSEEGSALILGRPFLMTTRTKIDVHAKILSMEFGNTFMKFNIFEALKHPTKDHSIFSIDAIEGLIEEYAKMSTDSADLESAETVLNNQLKAGSNLSRKES